MKKLLTLTTILSLALGTYADRVDDLVQQTLSQMTLKEKVRLCYAQSKFSSPGVPRLGIPELWWSDGPHGVRPEINWNDWGHAKWTNDSATAFPALTCLAATWNMDLATLYGANVGEEARYRHKAVLLGPGVNIFRTPLNGRNFEYMGEDPYLAGTLAAAYIRALQSKGVACSLKHFVLNDQEEYRGHVDVKVSDRALYEIYLAPFKKAVIDGGAWTVMGSYNKNCGTHMSHNARTLNDILKGEWGFKGVVVTDWGAAHDTKESIFNGLDVEMGSYTNGLTTEATGFTYDDYYLGNAYYDMARKGEVPDSIINDKAARILRLIYLTTLDSSKGFGALNTQEHLDAAQKISEEGIVLLKNKAPKGQKTPLLPLQKGAYKKILVVGENATRNLSEGGGSSELKPKTLISPLEAIKAEFGNSATIDYAAGWRSGKPSYGTPEIIPDSEQEALRKEAIEKARQADLIIYIGGLNKNHYEDCEGGDRRSYNLSYGQDQLISQLAKVQPNMVTVIISGTAYAMPWINEVSNLVQAWYMGSMAGTALVNVLTGTVNPSGKTVFTYAKELTDYPCHQMGKIGYPGVEPQDMPEGKAFVAQPKSADVLALGAQWKGINPKDPQLNTAWDEEDHHGKGNETQLYNEDILVGYRWFDTKKKAVLFPFGYGLSYTTFTYSDAHLSKKVLSSGEALDVTVKVKNSGKMAGKEVVQLYIGDDKSSVIRPAKELKAFCKVELQPGEEKTVTMTVTTDDLAFFDEAKHEWVAEPGTFKAYVGASSADIKAALPFKLTN
jgi:beta-glucosidase